MLEFLKNPLLGARVSEKVQGVIVKENETLVLLSVSRMKAACSAFLAQTCLVLFFLTVFFTTRVFTLEQKSQALAEILLPCFCFQMRKVPCLVKEAPQTPFTRSRLNVIDCINSCF